MQTLSDQLRLAGDGIEPEVDIDHFMKPEFAQHQRLMRLAAEELERLESEYAHLKMVAGTLAVHVRGHLTVASETSPAICEKWAIAVQDAVNDYDPRAEHLEAMAKIESGFAG